MALAYVLVLAIVALEVPLAVSTADRITTEIRSQARAQADVVAASASGLLAPADAQVLDTLVRRAARDVRGRVVIVDARGRLVADSSGSAEDLGSDYSDRPEIVRALAGETDQRERRSATLDEELLATAVPLRVRGRPAGAVRVTQSVAAVDRTIHRAWLGLAGIGVLVLLLGLGVGAVIAGQIARPVVRLEGVARRVADGDLGARAPVEGSAEQRTLAQTFNEMAERVQRLVVSQREFVADASHQLRTPLTGLRLRLEELQAQAPAGAARTDVEMAISEVDRLSVMVTELLELSRAGERDLPGELVDLGDAARRAAGRWAAEAEAGDHHVVVEGVAGTVLASRADLDRILDALIENALHYSPPATTVRLLVAPGVVVVRDQGPGVPATERAAVFERFHRGAAGRQGPPGTGLGLPIARELARRWGGDVVLADAPHGGTDARMAMAAL